MKNLESLEPEPIEVKPGPHTTAELKKIRDDFGPGADIALKSIYNSIGYKVTSHRGEDQVKPVGQ